MDFARKAEVRKLVLFHHDPYHTDDDLELLLVATRDRLRVDEDRICLAAEGMTIVCDRDGVRVA